MRNQGQRRVECREQGHYCNLPFELIELVDGDWIVCCLIAETKEKLDVEKKLGIK